jgi:hypothetical protein
MRDPRRLVDALAAPEAKRLLATLLDARPDLVAEVAALAGAELGSVTVQQVAEDVAGAIGALRIEKVWGRSGPQSDGSYVEPTEAVWTVFEESIAPFIEDLERRIRLDHQEAAIAICEGTLLGLYRVEKVYGEGFLDGHAPDLIGEAAGFVVETWKKSGGRARPRGTRDWAAMRAFVSKDVPEWQSFLIRMLGREPKQRRRR